MSDREALRIGWLRAVGVHAGRLLRRWLRSPPSVLSTLVMPVVMLVILNVMFSGMVEQFNSAPLSMIAV